MGVDLGALFRLDVSAVELMLRTSVVYLGLVAIMRVFGRREMGTLEMADILIIVLIADGVQSGMAGEYTSLTGAGIVAGTLVAWNYALDALAFYVPAVRRLLRPRPLKLVEDGRLIRRNMRRELVTREELEYELREQGIDDIGKVKLACMEPDGNLSVVQTEQSDHPNDDQQTGRRRRKSFLG